MKRWSIVLFSCSLLFLGTHFFLNPANTSGKTVLYNVKDIKLEPSTSKSYSQQKLRSLVLINGETITYKNRNQLQKLGLFSPTIVEENGRSTVYTIDVESSWLK